MKYLTSLLLHFYQDHASRTSLRSLLRFLAVLAEYQKAPDITRKRLYLQTMESVLGRSHKVLLDAQSSGNLLYLPIDRLIEGAGQRQSAQELDDLLDVDLPGFVQGQLQAQIGPVDDDPIAAGLVFPLDFGWSELGPGRSEPGVGGGNGRTGEPIPLTRRSRLATVPRRLV